MTTELKVLLLVAVFTALDTVFSTVRIILIQKGAALLSAGSKAVARLLFTLSLVFVMKDINTATVIVMVVVEFVATYLIVLVKNKKEKDEYWLLRATVRKEYVESFVHELTLLGLAYDTYEKTNHKGLTRVAFEIVCPTRIVTAQVKKIVPEGAVVMLNVIKGIMKKRNDELHHIHFEGL